jgi:FMN phosphatase YigB (HAD superfamily)
VTIQNTGIFDKKVVSFDFHGTLVERYHHHKHYNIGDSNHINLPLFEIFKRCLYMGQEVYIISFESVDGQEDEGIANNHRILKDNGVDFPIENIFCTDFKSKDQYFEDLGVQFHVDDDLGVILLARQMGIKTLLVDYRDHPVSSMFTRIRPNGKVIASDF